MPSSIEAIIDSANEVDTATGRSLGVAGWAFARKGYVLAVQVWAGETLLGHVPYGFPRPDVVQHFGAACPTEQVGFEGRVGLPAAVSDLNLRIVFVTDHLEKREVPIGSSEGASSNGEPEAAGAPSIPGPVSSTRLALPNFFILGAGKCGTTSLYHALKQHPQIHLPEVKEPSFFSLEFQVIKNPVDYFNLFPKQEGKRRYGEASHVYFSAPEAAPILAQLFPEAKFILIFRNPVNRAYSLYQHMRRAGDESLESFEQALAAEDMRFFDPVFRRDCPQYFWNFMYCRSSCYDEQLERYLGLFPLQQFFFLTLGEWKSDPAEWAGRLFEFLEVDPSVEVDVRPQNESGGYAPLQEGMKQRLATRFEGMRERLQSMIGRELQHWDE